MIDEKKVALMTKLEIFENKERDKSLVMSKFYKNDYVRFNVLKTIVAATVVYWLAIGMYAYMGFDQILQKINSVDYFDVMYKLLGGYVAFCVCYYLFATLVYNYRYFKAKKGLINYNVNLKKLIELEDGGASKGKVVDNSDLSITAVEKKPLENVQNEGDVVSNPRPARQTVSRSEMVKQRMLAEEKRKEQEIIENVKKRNERIAAQNEEKLRQERLLQQERQRIQERRRQLEREQMEKIRNERMDQFERENHEYMYSQNDNSKTGGEE